MSPQKFETASSSTTAAPASRSTVTAPSPAPSRDIRYRVDGAPSADPPAHASPDHTSTCSSPTRSLRGSSLYATPVATTTAGLRSSAPALAASRTSIACADVNGAASAPSGAATAATASDASTSALISA